MVSPVLRKQRSDDFLQARVGFFHSLYTWVGRWGGGRRRRGCLQVASKSSFRPFPSLSSLFSSSVPSSLPFRASERASERCGCLFPTFCLRVGRGRSSVCWRVDEVGAERMGRGVEGGGGGYGWRIYDVNTEGQNSC